MPDERDEIRARVSIVDLVGQTVALKRTGKTWKGLCPFHDDRNPSFTVSESTGHYKCWACGEGGDIFNWVMKTQNVEFVEALRILADRAGVILKPRSGERSKSQRELHASIMEEARAFFAAQLNRSVDAQEYLQKRGIDADTVKTWELGYAPDIDIALSTHLKKKGLPLPEAKSLFLVDSDAAGGFFDKFRGRLMFPIRDERGDLVAFGGRILGDGQPKYINSGDTPLFRKSRVLYGMHRGKDAIAKQGVAVLVEGYLDVIACHRAGVTTAVASLGTSLTEDHAKLLKRWCEEVVVFYDGDTAGQKAADRALDVLNQAGNRVRVALLPEGQDPDTLLRSAGASAVESAVNSGLSPLEFRIAMIETTLKPEGDEFWQAIVGALAASPSLRELRLQATKLIKEHYLGTGHEAAMRTLLADVQRVRTQNKSHSGQAMGRNLSVSALIGQRMSMQEAAVFKAVVEESTRREAWAILEEDGLMSSSPAIDLRAALLDAFGKESPSGPPLNWLARIEGEDRQALLSSLDQLLDSPSRESLLSNLALLRNGRENRLATALAEVDAERDLVSIMERLRAAKPLS